MPLSASIRVFLLIWLGQFISQFGSGLTAFALGPWVYLRTGSATLVSLVWLASALPDLLLSPLAGALVDRWNRRLALLISDLGAALGTLVLAVLAVSGTLQVWQVLLACIWVSAFVALQWPAYSAVIPLLVSREQLGRASGMVQTAGSIASLAAPAVAGLLIATVQLGGILFVDFATFVVSLLTLIVVRVPDVLQDRSETGAQPSVWQDLAGSWRYIRERRGLLLLLFYFASVNVFVGFAQVLLVPLVLSFTSTAALGTMMSLGGAAMVLASLFLSTSGGFEHRVRAVLGLTVALGFAVVLCGSRPNPILVGAGVILALFVTPLLEGTSQVIWHAKTAPEMMGRVFALRKLAALFPRPIAYLAAGPLADRIFEPKMRGGSGLSDLLSPWLGRGPGRGTALLYVCAGALIVVVALVGALSPRLRNLEKEVPDAAPTAAEETGQDSGRKTD
ncbi:MAG TPA: MFS transporter [Thermoanaerobaculia bacterium]|nr:MFS transporter [Thermoanaerobaculia bacterium]